LDRAKYSIIYPKNIQNLCCGMPFGSKGFKDEASRKLEELKEALFEASEGGKYPILCDTSPCAKTIIKGIEDLKVYEPIEFSLKFLAPRLKFKKLDEPITIHSTCSTKVLGVDSSFLELAKMCSKSVIVPKNVSCCGFAGDRGFNYPELNQAALRWIKSETKGAKSGYSTSATCEMGLSFHSELEYKSILYLVEKCTKEVS
jgi:D-lactate dehydrogenase